METEKIGVLDQLAYSVQPSKYKELVGQPRRKIITYTLFLAVLVAFMQVVIPVIGWFSSFGGLDHLFTEVLPVIELQDGKLSVGNKIEIGTNGSTYVLIDTERVTMQQSDLDTKKYSAEILVAEENMIIYNSMSGTMELKFADLGDVTLNNDSLVSSKFLVYLVIGLTFLLQIGNQILELVLSGFFLVICCWGPFRIKKAPKMRFPSILALAIYAQTAMRLLLAFNSCVEWIPDVFLLYIGMGAALFILMSGLSKMEERVHE